MFQIPQAWPNGTRERECEWERERSGRTNQSTYLWVWPTFTRKFTKKSVRNQLCESSFELQMLRRLLLFFSDEKVSQVISSLSDFLIKLTSRFSLEPIPPIFPGPGLAMYWLELEPKKVKTEFSSRRRLPSSPVHRARPQSLSLSHTHTRTHTLTLSQSWCIRADHAQVSAGAAAGWSNIPSQITFAISVLRQLTRDRFDEARMTI